MTEDEARLFKMLSEKEEIILELKKELQKRWERIEELMEEFPAKNYRINTLCDVVESQRDRINNLDSENSRLAETVLELGRKLELHERFHLNIGCPGRKECYVCKEDYE